MPAACPGEVMVYVLVCHSLQVWRSACGLAVFLLSGVPCVHNGEDNHTVWPLWDPGSGQSESSDTWSTITLLLGHLCMRACVCNLLHVCVMFFSIVKLKLCTYIMYTVLVGCNCGWDQTTIQGVEQDLPSRQGGRGSWEVYENSEGLWSVSVEQHC